MKWWSEVEDAPEITAALIAEGLPVARCERQTGHPFYVRTHWSRPPTAKEETRAANIRARLRSGQTASPLFEDAPEYTAALVAAGLPVASCQRQTREPYHVKTTWTRTPTDTEKNLASDIRSHIRRGLPSAPRFRPEHRARGKAPAKPLASPPPPDDFPSAQVDASRAERLALAVIRQACADVLLPPVGTHGATIVERQQSRMFLTATEGPWAAMREQWCAMADRNADSLRRWAERALAEGLDWTAFRRSFGS